MKKRSLITNETQLQKFPKCVSKFLLKSEPDLPISSISSYGGITVTKWDGIRNYQARNIQREMKIGDLCFFYHANINKKNGIYGIVEVCSEPYEDEQAHESSSRYFDPKSIPGSSKWLAVDIKLKEIWDKPVLLTELKKEILTNQNSPINQMMLFKMSRLSTQRVSQLEWDHILEIKSST